MSRRKHSVLAALLCAVIAATSVLPTNVAYATSAGAGKVLSSKGQTVKNRQTLSGSVSYNALPLSQAKTEALKELKDYYEAIVVGMTKANKEKAKKLYNQYVKTINATRVSSSLEKTLEIATNAFNKLADDGQADNSAENDDPSKENVPTSSSDLIMVGGDWITPVARAGQQVSVVLPVVNMMQGINLNNVIVTPVVATTTSEWPFEIQTSGYTQTIADLPGSGNGQSDMDRRRELTWNFKTKQNVLNGYYKVPFLVNYIDPGTKENVQVTLTTYVLCVGKPGAGNVVGDDEGKYATPRVIVTGYDTNPAEVHAGDTFTLTLHLKNTSVNTTVANMLVHLSTPTEGQDNENSYSAFLPTGGSNTFYVDQIGKGGTTDLSIEMTAKNDLTQKPYSLDVSMDYEDENINPFTSNADISIMVKQNPRFEFSSPEITPNEIAVGDQANVMFSIYNTGRVSLYNVHVGFEGDTISAEDSYIGKIEAGGNGMVDVMVTGENATTDDGTVKIVMTYEDEDGNQTTYEQDMTLMVNDSGFSGGDMPFEMDPSYEEEPQGPNIWLIIAIIVAIIIVIVVVVVLVIFLKKKKAAAEVDDLLEGLDEDLFGDDSDTNDDKGEES